MLKRSLIWTAAALLLSLVVASPAAAQAPARKGLVRNILVVFAPPSPEEERSIATRVGMDQDQKTRMRAVNDRYRSDSTTLRAKYDAAYDDVVRLMQATNPNKGDVNQVLKTFHQIHEQVLEREVGYWEDFKAILTPEQNQKFWNMFEQNRIRQGGGGQGAGVKSPGAN
jgi:Spy/CpxP family protein refolding chaperone